MQESNTGDVATGLSCGYTLCLTPMNLREVDGWDDDGGNHREGDTWWHVPLQPVF